MCSAARCSTTRLVTSSVSRVVCASSSASSDAAATTCSRLSTISNACRSRSAACTTAMSGCPPCSPTPSVEPMAGTTSDGSVIGARSTNQTPSGNAGPSAVPASSARRVLPLPPGPVSVSRLTSSRSSSAVTAASSRSRPTSASRRSGRLPRATRWRLSGSSGCRSRACGSAGATGCSSGAGGPCVP